MLLIRAFYCYEMNKNSSHSSAEQEDTTIADLVAAGCLCLLSVNKAEEDNIKLNLY